MAEQRQSRYTVEAKPVGCLEKNLTLRTDTLAEAIQVAAWLLATSRVPAVAVVNHRGELVAAG